MKLVLTSIYVILVLFVVAVAILFVGNRVGVFGYQIKIVQSGSMEPAIATGGMIIIAPAASYGVGDVITFGEDTATKIPTTHRITAIETSPLGRSLYTTKGDANEEADPIAVRDSDIIGKVFVAVPYVGYLLEFARTPLGYGLLVGIPAAFIILDEFANIMWEFHKYRARRRQSAGKREPKASRQPLPGLHPTTVSQRAAAPVRRPVDYVLDLRGISKLPPSFY